MENPIQMDDLGVPLFLQTSILGNLDIQICLEKSGCPSKDSGTNIANHQFSIPSETFKPCFLVPNTAHQTGLLCFGDVSGGKLIYLCGGFKKCCDCRSEN